MVRRVAIVVLRLVGLVVFGYWALLLGFAVVNLLTPQHTIRGTYGPYDGPATLAALGVVASVILCYRLLRSASVRAELAWLVGGAVGLYAFAFIVVILVPAYP